MIDHRSPSLRLGPRPSWIVRNSLLLVALAAVAPASVRGAVPVEIENLRIGFSVPGGEDGFKIGAWAPVWVQLKGGAERFSGYMDVVAADDDGAPTAFRQAVDVPAGETRRFAGYIRPGGRDSDLTIRFYSEDGRWLGEREQARIMRAPPRAIMPDETLVVIAGQPRGIDQVPAAAGFQQANSAAANSGDAEIVVSRLDVEGDRVPGRWYGFDGARALVLDTADRASLDLISGLRGQAVVDWVQRGGHLIVGVGVNWQAVRDSVLGPALPAVLAGQERVQSLEALDLFARSTKSITPPGTPPQMIVKLEELDERGGSVLASVSNLPVVVRGAYGFGRVTLIGVDVDQKMFSDWPDRGLFWIQALDLKRNRPNRDPGMMGPRGSFYSSGVTDLASQLRVALEQFPHVKLIPFGWVAFLIFLYILAIGPGDYLFLKRVLKRMELTWVTFPAIVATVSLLAYYAAYRLKGNELLVNKVDVVDVDQVSGLTRGRSWATLFSPQNRDYGIGFLPAALDGGAGAEPPALLVGPGEPPRPAAGVEVLTTWFGVPENQFGAMGGASQRFNFGGGGYSYEPINTAERLRNVRIPIWSTKTVASRWFAKSAPLIESDLRPFGADRLAGTIVNLLSYPLEDAVIAFGRQVYTIGDVAPGQSINVQLANDRNLSGLLKEKRANYLPESGRNRDLKLRRDDLMLAVMFHESEDDRSNEHALGNATLHDLDLTGQLSLQRPMLVARINRPAARLALENAPGEPKLEQTTMLRIILPLKQPKKGARVAAQ